jgi:hypothetical protein
VIEVHRLVLALGPGVHQFFFARHAELLRERRLLDTQHGFELADAEFTLGQSAQQQQAVGVAERLRQCARPCGGGLRFL